MGSQVPAYSRVRTREWHHGERKGAESECAVWKPIHAESNMSLNYALMDMSMSDSNFMLQVTVSSAEVFTESKQATQHSNFSL